MTCTRCGGSLKPDRKGALTCVECGKRHGLEADQVTPAPAPALEADQVAPISGTDLLGALIQRGAVTTGGGYYTLRRSGSMGDDVTLGRGQEASAATLEAGGEHRAAALGVLDRSSDPNPATVPADN